MGRYFDTSATLATSATSATERQKISGLSQQSQGASVEHEMGSTIFTYPHLKNDLSENDSGHGVRTGSRIREPDTPLLPSGMAANDDLRHAFEERAAIMEYDGGMTRDDAERMAAVETGFDPNSA